MASVQALDVGRDVVDDPGVVSPEDSGFCERGVLTVEGKVSSLQERGWVASGLKVNADKARAGEGRRMTRRGRRRAVPRARGVERRWCMRTPP
jgi:hypothetical protein